MKERLERVDREALVHNEKPMALSFFPSGEGTAPLPLVRLQDGVTQVGAAKQSEDGKALIVRLFEPTGKARATTLHIPALDMRVPVKLGGFEIQTLRVDLKKRTAVVTDLLERPGGKGKG